MDKTERILVVIAFLLLLPAFFINLGEIPLYLEEPRRALIALEMIFRDNWIVPTQTGELYFNKPPLYNWLLIAAYQLFGNYSEFASRFFSIISFLLMGGMVFRMGKKYVDLRVGAYSGLMVLVSVDILFYFSITSGEIDLFYSMLTLAGFFGLFYFYEKRWYYFLFLSFYGLNALGFLTKGLPSLAFIGLSLAVFVWINNHYKLLFHAAHFSGIFLFLGLVGGYYYLYSLHQPLTPFIATLWEQSSQRTVLDNQLTAFLGHLFLFPLELLKYVAPASLLLLAIPWTRVNGVLRENKFIYFCGAIFFANIIVYWISPGTRSRYLYMLLPLLVLVFSYVYFRFNSQKEGEQFTKYFEPVVSAILGIGALAVIFVPFHPRLNDQTAAWIIGILGFIAFSGFFLAQRRWRQYSLIILLLAVILSRWMFNFTVIPERATTSSAAKYKAVGEQIAEISGDNPLYLWQDTRISLTSVFYVERARREVLGHQNDPKSGSYYIAPKEELDEQASFQGIYFFNYDNRTYGVFRYG